MRLHRIFSYIIVTLGLICSTDGMDQPSPPSSPITSPRPAPSPLPSLTKVQEYWIKSPGGSSEPLSGFLSGFLNTNKSLGLGSAVECFERAWG
jgi:hypothetical protein